MGAGSRDLRAEVVLLEQGLAARDRELMVSEEALRQLRGRHRCSLLAEGRRTRALSAPGHGRVFSDPIEQLRFEVHLAWALRIPADDEPVRPLRPHPVGDDVLASLELAGTGARRGSALGREVFVDILTWIADTSAGRDVHALRTGPGGGPGCPTHRLHLLGGSPCSGTAQRCPAALLAQPE